MAYQEITHLNSPNFTGGRGGRNISGITIHWWGDPGHNPSFEGVCSWLCNPRSQVSAHEVVTGTGRRSACLVEYRDTAWHAGNWTGNTTTVGIECDPRCRDEDYDTVAEVIADIWIVYGKLPLHPHRSWTATSCPGNYDLGRLQAEAEAWYQRKTNPQPAPKPAPVPAPAPAPAPAPRPEWERNLKDITATKLTVLPAEGVRVLNLTNLQHVNDTIIPRGTQVDIVKETTVDGRKYYISSYSAQKGLPWGIVADSLGVPKHEPEKEKPEWLKNLKDVEDKDFWTRSETPVLNLENGDVIKRLPVNTKVRATHATVVLGQDLLVLDGGKVAIEPLYLSDTPIDTPLLSIEKRVKALEKLVGKIVEFLTSVFKNFKK